MIIYIDTSYRYIDNHPYMFVYLPSDIAMENGHRNSGFTH